MAAAGDSEVLWDASNSRFATKDGLAYLQYIIQCKNHKPVMDLVHTYVPPSKRGGGVAARLCAAAFEHAQKNGYLVIPTCSYISETFLPRNAMWKEIIFTPDQYSWNERALL
ncbi:hypothetical protein KP509_15G032700 [Ceratopteris richardii]|uniref:N-acetyltransferase domain-containing protein n=1 Tax=Ceratopteris richardii TaxID=49495 RepID=A0A8T2T285_CERRI|nr:hypothetical protein KP509_15G032700 [Ceratopteris richardii]